MKFLQAHSLLKGFTSEKKRRIKLVMSGQSENLTLFIRAEYALAGIDCEIETIPFNTLHQYLLGPREADITECFLLFPWDLLPSLDWRSGIGPVVDDAALAQQLEHMSGLLQQRDAQFFYTQASALPLHSSIEANQRVMNSLFSVALQLNASLLPPHAFSLTSYLNYGVPFASNHCGDIAERVCKLLLPQSIIPKKLLITDLDNVMWAGVIGEDGIEGINYAPEGAGYPHFIYQTYLRKFKTEGVLLAAVSKNDPDLAGLPFQLPGAILKEQDFVTILASYQEKSAQIAALVSHLNIGLAACVFVDDNPVEIAEISQQLPGISCVTFPSRADDLADFFAQLERYFSNANLTAEDQNRTRLYRTRLAGMVPVASAGVNLDNFLRDLEMELQILDRTHGPQDRAIQLINKTNQFNLNGIRYAGDEVQQLLAQGGRLFTASLKDKHGDHGEIIACLLNRDEEIVSLVMSCRVMQRKVEQVFLAWLACNSISRGNICLRFLATQRNTPVQQFLASENFMIDPGSSEIYCHSKQEFISKQVKLTELFNISLATDGR